MTKKRSFSDDDIRTKSDDYHGLAHYVRTQPDIGAQGVKSANIELNFDEALKLSLAVQACLMQLNRYNRSTIAGREMGMLLSIKTDSRSITVIEKRVPPVEDVESQ
jgi:hypothetical protein